MSTALQFNTEAEIVEVSLALRARRRELERLDHALGVEGTAEHIARVTDLIGRLDELDREVLRVAESR